MSTDGRGTHSSRQADRHTARPPPTPPPSLLSAGPSAERYPRRVPWGGVGGAPHVWRGCPAGGIADAPHRCEGTRREGARRRERRRESTRPGREKGRNTARRRRKGRGEGQEPGQRRSVGAVSVDLWPRRSWFEPSRDLTSASRGPRPVGALPRRPAAARSLQDQPAVHRPSPASRPEEAAGGGGPKTDTQVVPPPVVRVTLRGVSPQ